MKLAITMLASLLIGCNVYGAGATVIMGKKRPALKDLVFAQNTMKALADCNVTIDGLEQAGLRPSFVTALREEEAKNARITILPDSPSTASVLLAFQDLDADAALQFTEPAAPVSCNSLPDCAVAGDLLCVTKLGGQTVGVKSPVGSSCPVLCKKAGIQGAAVITCH